MAKNTNHYEIIKTYVTYEDKIYYKNYLCRKDDGQIVKIKKKIALLTQSYLQGILLKELYIHLKCFYSHY